MIKQFRQWIVVVASAVVLALSLGALVPAPAYADISSDQAKDSACAGIGGKNASGDCTVKGPKLNDIIAAVINLLSIAVGIAAVIMIIVGGFKYITAAGDSSNITSAKNTIVYAIIGLVVVALAQAIVRFVVNKTT